MADRTLYIATSNPGKLRDFAAASLTYSDLSPNIAIAPMPCLDRIPPPPENELTFEGNARAKAIYYSRLAPGFDVLADDSGIEVDFLNGDPGVRSARFAADAEFAPTGDPDADNNLLLLQKLAHVATDLRTARYRCVLALARDGECMLTAQGSVEGRIATQSRGDGGFGYDPLFLLPELDQTMAQLPSETRQTLSHRGRALRALFGQLNISAPTR
jgi:XTP/dITP diphosphohydrolase